MKIFKYIFEFIIIITFFLIFKIIGYKNASNLGEFIGKKIGPFFRSKSMIHENLKNSKIGASEIERNIITNNMWGKLWKNIVRIHFLKKISK